MPKERIIQFSTYPGGGEKKYLIDEKNPPIARMDNHG